jgi:hypothetical protein
MDRREFLKLFGLTFAAAVVALPETPRASAAAIPPPEADPEEYKQFFVYNYQVRMPRKARRVKARVVIGGDAPFRLNMLNWGSAGPFRIWNKNGDLQFTFSGQGLMPMLIAPAVDFPAGTVMEFDIVNLSGRRNDIWLGFTGSKIRYGTTPPCLDEEMEADETEWAD